jgi:ATP-dependent DNA helicase RecG
MHILLYLLDNKKVSRKKAADIIGLKNTAPYEVLTEMVSDGLIEKQGQGRTTHYTLAVGDIR